MGESKEKSALRLAKAPQTLPKQLPGSKSDPPYPGHMIEVSGYAVSLIKLMTRIVTPTEPRMSRLWGHFSWASHYGGGQFIEDYVSREGVGDHGHRAGG